MAEKLTLIGAYGRGYLAATSALTDWSAGKDFKIMETGQYCSIRDIEKLIEMADHIYIGFAGGVVEIYCDTMAMAVPTTYV